MPPNGTLIHVSEGAAVSDGNVVSRLGATWFGAELPLSARERLAGVGELRRVEAGAVLLREGGETERLGILLSGLLSLRVAVAGRGRATLMTVEPGDIFGWTALVPPYRATSTVVALEASEVIVFDAVGLRDLLRDDESLALSLYPRLLQSVSRRLVATRNQLLDLYARDSEYEPW
jgi:CRP-like cAMP-binding protein